MSTCRFENGADLSADDVVEKVVAEIAARNFHKPSSWNTYIGFRLRCGRLNRELRAYISIYRKHFDCCPNYNHLMAVGECIYPLFEKRDDWKSLGSSRQEILVVEEVSFGQIQQITKENSSITHGLSR
jgi:hypothetical protein